MTPERWSEVEKLFNAVQERGRDALSGVDPELRHHVEELLAQDETGAFLGIDDGRTGESMREASIVGSRMGPYRIDSVLGKGGMGEVYRATDMRLNRPVALKRCDSRFIARFDREAKAISALNHPHICTLYDVGSDYLVMELIEGETLAARILQCPMSLDDVCRYGSEIADALGEAHAAGIAHRDLKPSNIMVTPRGIKVVDFGLAGPGSISGSSLTLSHTVMGTPAYMAPEQAKGKRADARADLFSLGVILYEMAAGKLPFPGASLGNMLSNDDTIAIPPVTRLRPEFPAPLSALISRLLVPDPAKRTATASQVRDELRSLAPHRGHHNRKWLTFAAAVSVVALATTALWWGTSTRTPVPLQPDKIYPIVALPGDKLDPAFSPDGSMLAFSWKGIRDDKPGIYVVPVVGGDPRRLTQSTTNDNSPAWSPNGKQIAFHRVRPNQPNELMVVSVADGVEQKLRDVRLADSLSSTSVTWTPDGKALLLGIYDPEVQHGSLFRVSLDGAPLFRILRGTNDSVDLPSVSPDGRWLAYRRAYSLWRQRLNSAGLPEGEAIEIYKAIDIKSPVWRPDSGQLLFLSQTESRLLAWDVATQSTATIYFSLQGTQSMTATWSGSEGPRAVLSSRAGQTEIRILDLIENGHKAAGDSRSLLQSAVSAAYSNNGNWIAFSRTINGSAAVWLADSNGQNARPVATIAAPGLREISWAPDDQHLAFHARVGQKAQVYIVDIAPEAEMVKPPTLSPALSARQVVYTDFNLVAPHWSADGKFLYVLRYDAGQMMRVPVAGGELEDLFESDSATVFGESMYYHKPSQTSLFVRSLVGVVRSNPEERILTDSFLNAAPAITEDGIFYVGVDSGGNPVTIRFYDFSQRRSADIAPLKIPSSARSTLSVSRDRKHLLYDVPAFHSGEWMLLQLREHR